jgi:elongation factor P
MQAKDLRRGTIILYNGVAHRVLEAQHRTPGNLRAFVQAKLRNLVSGLSTETRFSSTEHVERVRLEQQEMEYLYADGETHHFMNIETYDQIELDDETLGEATRYLLPGARIHVELFEGKPIGIEVPAVVELTIVETEPEMRGATAAKSRKPARMETGLVVQVPPFVKEGDRVRIDTATGEYLERAD